MKIERENFERHHRNITVTHTNGEKSTRDVTKIIAMEKVTLTFVDGERQRAHDFLQAGQLRLMTEEATEIRDAFHFVSPATRWICEREI